MRLSGITAAAVHVFDAEGPTTTLLAYHATHCRVSAKRQPGGRLGDGKGDARAAQRVLCNITIPAWRHGAGATQCCYVPVGPFQLHAALEVLREIGECRAQKRSVRQLLEIRCNPTDAEKAFYRIVVGPQLRIADGPVGPEPIQRCGFELTIGHSE